VAEPLPDRLTPGRHGKAEGPPGVVLRERPPGRMASVIARRGAEQALASALRRDLVGGASTVLGVGPGHWWIVAETAQPSVDDLQEMYEGVASVFDITDSRVVLEIGGPRIRETLAKMLPIDLHPSAFKTGDVAVTVASHIGVTLWRTADARTADAPRYRLAVPRSYSTSFWRAFVAAAAEHGCEVSPEVSP
jgi:heterotetrameric sarcosine oxidase gamma subunit